jgi:sugar phosphate isomerase/epimerase
MPFDYTLNRRSFLLTAAASAGVLCRSVTAAGSDDFGGFTVGVQSYTFRNFNLEHALKRTQEVGLRYAEFYRGHISPDASPESIKAAKKLCEEYGVTPIAFGVERFTKNHDTNKKLFDFAASLGVKHLSADPDPDSFDSLDKLVDEYKITIAIHPHGPAGGNQLHRWYSAEVIMKAVKDRHPLIGSCLDTGHLIRAAQLGEKLDPAQQVRVMGERNFGMHLKDHDNKRRTDVVFGDPNGSLDVAAVLRALQDVNFKGYISIEYEANPDDPSSDVKKCVAYLKQAIKKLG